MSAEYDQPLIAIDVVPMSFSIVDKLQVATAERQFDPFAGQQALPGVLMRSGELLEQAARRALADKAGIEEFEIRHLVQLGVFDRPGRDPRSHAISVGFLAVTDPGAGTNTTWTNAGPTLGLPFDHDVIIAAALEQARLRLWSDPATTRAFTGAEFPGNLASQLTNALTDGDIHVPTLLRSLANNPDLTKMDERRDSGRGRSIWWKWTN